MDDDIDEGAGMKLAHDVLAVGVDGGGADAETLGYLLADIALTKHKCNFDFAGGEGRLFLINNGMRGHSTWVRAVVCGGSM